MCRPALSLLVAMALLAALAAASASAQEEMDHRRRTRQAREAAKDLAQKAGSEAGRLAEQLNNRLARFKGHRIQGWIVAVILLGFGSVCLLFGWALLRSMFVPISVVISALLGAFVAGEIATGLSGDGATGLHVGAMMLGAVLLTALDVVLARKARPMAWLLVISAPFLCVSAFLFPLGLSGMAFALGVVAVGLAVGFVAAVHHRFLTIVSNSFLGAVCVLSGLSVVAQLTGLEPVLDALDWGIENGWPVPLALAVVTVAGANFQATFGPVAEEDSGEHHKRRQLTPVERGF